LILISTFFLCFGDIGTVFAEPLNEDQQYQAAVQLFNQKQWNAASNAFHEFQKKFPKSRWKYAVQIRLADLESEPAKAVKLYEGIVEQAGESEWAADAKWGLAVSFFVLGQYQQALLYLRQIKPISRLRHAHALYLAGLSNMALRKYKQARQNFNQVLESYGDTEWAGLSLVGAGESALALKDTTAALSAFDRYLREYPQGDLTHIVLMQKSKALQAQGMEEESARMLHELVTRYTETYEAEKAKRKLCEVQKKFTIQVGAFSKAEYARKLVKRLRRKGYNAYILVVRNGNEVFNQVRVGSYTTREFSEKIAKKLAQTENLPYIILPYVKPDTP